MKQWLQRMMYGRYGVDKFSYALVIGSLVISILGSFTGLGILVLLSYLPLGFAFWRIFSKNIQKRAAENSKYLQLRYRVTSYFATAKQRKAERKDYRFFSCPHCKKMLRVPRGKGKLQITCPMCKHQFVKKT